MRIVELIIENLNDGIDAISLVDRPAIESNFIALNENIKIEFKEVDKERGILMGAALIPDKQIFRKGKDEDYYVYFSKDTIRQASEMFFKNGNQSKATLQHQKAIKGMTIVESWIVEDSQKDKSNLYGFSYPEGTWVVSMKVDNPEIKEDVKNGKIKGFSIEGYFTDKIELIKEETLIDKIKKILKNEQENIKP